MERLKSSDNYLHFLLLHELSTFDALEPMRNGFSTAEELRKQNIAYFEDAESRGLRLTDKRSPTAEMRTTTLLRLNSERPKRLKLMLSH